ncbi:MAG: cysteine desulfurase family protein [Bdellovibrionota bacterium]
MPTSNSSNFTRVYLDHNATTPISDRVRSRVPDWLEHWGNPSSIHQAGRGPKTVMREARSLVAKFLGVNPLELIFTSGGSEANNLALKGIFEDLRLRKSDRNRFVVSSVEHPSIKRTTEYLAAHGVEIVVVPVNRSGEIDRAAYSAAVNEKTALVSIMFANNETGNVFPIKELAAEAHAKGALFHSDCVQALGKIDINLSELGVDLASFSGHKFYSLKGAGVLFAKRGVPIESLIHGGGQERHRRGGTENTLAIAALAAMCELKDSVTERAEEMRGLRDYFEARVKKEISEVRITGAESLRLPNTSSLIIPGVDGEILLMNLDLKGFAVSTGAACSSGSPEPSPVLLAMGLSRKEAQSSLRVGLGWSTTRDDVDRFTDTLVDIVKHLRKIIEASQFKGEPCAVS